MNEITHKTTPKVLLRYEGTNLYPVEGDIQPTQKDQNLRKWGRFIAIGMLAFDALDIASDVYFDDYNPLEWIIMGGAAAAIYLWTRTQGEQEREPFIQLDEDKLRYKGGGHVFQSVKSIVFSEVEAIHLEAVAIIFRMKNGKKKIFDVVDVSKSLSCTKEKNEFLQEKILALAAQKQIAVTVSPYREGRILEKYPERKGLYEVHSRFAVKG